ncbi:MAG TPA: hypothetical protein DDZ76_14875, partial [Xanthomonadales bacterium]|nr:hypothetical protein [Xanthomonadales bacterium]
MNGWDRVSGLADGRVSKALYRMDWRERSAVMTLMTRGVLMAVLVLAGVVPAQGQGSSERARAEHRTGLARAAERQGATADRMLAEGRRLLRDPRLGGHALLRSRQGAAEAAYRGSRGSVERLLARADGPDGADAGVLAELDGLLRHPDLLDWESVGYVRPSTAEGEGGSGVQSVSSDGTVSTLRSAPAAVDLQATLDAPQTAAIEALAVSLEASPVRIHEWVRREIGFIPTRGSIQGAAGTLATRQGNATDIASLEVALLRSAGVPARYVRGWIEVDAVRMQAWLGVDRVEAVAELLAEGGLAFEPVIEGGVPSRFRLQHVWVEAWVDMVPSRGLRQVEGDAWVALDAAFKVYRRTVGPDLLAWLALDA